jgi:Short C-terminal domain
VRPDSGEVGILPTVRLRRGPAGPGTTESSHRIAATVLVVLGALCILISTISVWIRDIALDSDVWSDTSAQLLQSENVREALSVYIVDQAYSSADAEARLEAALPERLKPLAGQIASQLRVVAYESARRALERPRVQELWRSTNRAVNEQLVALLEGDTERVQLTNDAVVLDVDQIVENVAGRFGAGDTATETVQERVEPIVIMRSDQLSTAQTLVKILKALSFWPLILGVALWAGAVYLAHGRRRETVRAIAISLIVLGFFLLVVLRIGGNAIVESLVQAESVKPAAHDVWTIFTSLLRESAIAGVVVGVLGVASAWVIGPTRRATALRRGLAPTFRDRPVLVHGVLAAVILLLLLWGPVGTPRRFISVLIVTALAFAGLEVLRRQTVREFPDAIRSEGGMLARLRRRGEPAGREAVAAGTVDRLERLAALHERGALTDEEYEAEKALLLT